MAIPKSLDQLQMQSYVESVSVPNVPAVRAVNPDGTDIGAGGGVSEIEGKVAAGDPNTTKPVKVGAVHNTVLPTYNDGEQTDLQADDRGRLITTATLSSDVASESPDTENPIKVGARYDAVLPTYTDGDKTNFQADINGRLIVNAVGNVAAQSADSGNPVKVGAVFNEELPHYLFGDRTDLQSDARGLLLVGGNVASNGIDFGHPIKVGGRYNSTAPTLDSGDRGDLQLDVNGRLLVTSVTGEVWLVDSSANLEAVSLIKNSPGRIKKFSGRLNSTAPSTTYYLQFINSTTVPADGAVTLLCAPVKLQHTNGEDTPILINFPGDGLTGSVGLVWVLSSTEFTKTVTSSYISADVFYI